MGWRDCSAKKTQAVAPTVHPEFECCRRNMRELQAQLTATEAQRAMATAVANCWRGAFLSVVAIFCIMVPLAPLLLMMQWDVLERLVWLTKHMPHR